MRVEILFPEMGIYYGDYGNILYLKKCLPAAEFIYTDNLSVPLFVNEKVDLVYMGSLSEHKQEIAIERLKQYKDILRKRIDENTIFLFTGNSMEILGRYIETQDKKIECLGLYDFFSKRDMNKRLNYLFKGTFEDICIVGNKSQYSQCYGNIEQPFIRVEKGMGNHLEDLYEGIHDHNLFATFLLGPFLVLNPLFTEKLIRLIDSKQELACKKQVMEAYEKRLSEMNRPEMQYKLSEH